MKLLWPIVLFLWSSLRPIAAECGYNACHKTDPKKLNIHLVAHSHDDVGWIIPAHLYYDLLTRPIVTTVVESLLKNEQRKFTQVEMYYFNHWWREQNQTTRNQVTQLVNTGRLVFTNGGWTVNDEGVAHYNNIIDQLTLGHKLLNDTFGQCALPKVSWQIDPFGASREMASLYAQMGFDGHVVNRGPTSDKGEYVWKASDDLNTRIFSTVLHDHYSPPVGFNYENTSDFITDQNKAAKADQFVALARGYAQDYGQTNEVLMPMGSDFNYIIAENWFSNMDKLIAEVKSRHSDVDIFYSTPNCYIYGMNSVNKTFAERTVDYLTYWSGYYTSRPALKYQDRITNGILQASKQLDVVSRQDPTRSHPHLAEARNQVAVLTHHDAITGTSPQRTADDYTSRLQSGYSASKAVIQKAYRYLKNKQKSDSTEVFCDSLNITECSLTETKDKIAVTVYNPIARQVSQWLRVPVRDGLYVVYDSTGQKVNETSILAVADAVKCLPERKSGATHELLFKGHLPALGFTTYFVEKQKTGLTSGRLYREKRAVDDLKGKSFSVQIDETTGALKTVTINGKTHRLNQSFKWYKSMAGQSGREDSGSYQFCPDGAARDYDQPKLISRHTSGPVHEVQQQFSDYIKQTVRTYEDEHFIEFDWTVGPIPVDSAGKEIITRFETDFKTDNVFYTDANGRQTVERKFDPKKKACDNNEITGNYYPIYSRIAIRDQTQDLQMTVLTDRTQGGSSLTEGEVELMVHRRLTRSGKGGNFVIDEPGVDGKGMVIRGRHYLFFQPINESVPLVRSLSQSLFMAPILSFSEYSTIKDYSSEKEVSFSALSKPLPENIHLLTLENWRPNQVLLRLEHRSESSDGVMANTVDIDLNSLFTTFKVLDAVEMTLSANEELKSSKRLQWNSHSASEELPKREKRATDLNVSLSPQQIRTFIVTIKDNIHKEEKCKYSWVKATKSTVPKQALVAGLDNKNQTINICRSLVNSTDMIAGRVDKQSGCVTTKDGKEVTNESFEVLEATGVEWVARHGTDPLPDQSLDVGDRPMAHTYVGRTVVNGSLQIGKIDLINSDYNFFYGYQGLEVPEYMNHEVLVCLQ